MNSKFANYDVALVGAGPSGSSAAIRLAQNGLKVLLVEQKKFPRAKLCGEFISPECLSHFGQLKVLDAMLSANAVELDRTVFYTRKGRSIAVPSNWFTENTSAIGLSRAQMDLELLERARSVGAHVLEETYATALLLEEKKVCGITLRNKERDMFDVRATITIDATGRAKILSRLIEKRDGNVQRRRADFVAFKTHLRKAEIPEGACEIYGYRGGYGGLSSVENGLSNLCFIVAANIAKKYYSDAAEVMRNVVFENKRAEQALFGAEIFEDWLAVPLENYGRSSLSPAEGLLSVGDAAAFIDPFTGSGILLALESAKIVAEVIVRGFSSNKSFSAIASAYRERSGLAFDGRLRISSFVRLAAFAPFLAEAMVKTLSLSDRLTHRLAKATRPI